MTKEQIREKHLFRNGLSVNKGRVGEQIQKAAFDAMEDYAKQEAIKFHEFFAKTSISNPDKVWKIYQDNVQSKQK